MKRQSFSPININGNGPNEDNDDVGVLFIDAEFDADAEGKKSLLFTNLK